MIKNLVTAIGLSLLLITTLTAQDASEKTKSKTAVEKTGKKEKKQGKKKVERYKTKVSQQITKELAAIELTADQKTKLATLVDEKVAKLIEVDDAIAGMVPKDKRKQRREAFKTSKQSGKSYKEAFKAALVAIGMSEEDQKKIGELGQSRKTLLDSIRTDLESSLSMEQKETLAASKKKKKKGGKMKGDKKKGSEAKDDKKMDKDK